MHSFCAFMDPWSLQTQKNEQKISYRLDTTLLTMFSKWLFLKNNNNNNK